MKKLLLATLISLGLCVTAYAQSKTFMRTGSYAEGIAPGGTTTFPVIDLGKILHSNEQYTFQLVNIAGSSASGSTIVPFFHMSNVNDDAVWTAQITGGTTAYFTDVNSGNTYITVTSGASAIAFNFSSAVTPAKFMRPGVINGASRVTPYFAIHVR